MRRRRAMAAVAALALAAPGGRAAAEMPVIDTAAIAKFSEQITKLQRQIESLVAIQKSAQEQIDAVGRSGRITLPAIHIGKMAAQIASGARCLKPDFSKLMPRVDFRDVRVGSICDGAAMYGQTLFVRPEDLSGIEDWRAMAKLERAAGKRRDAVLRDAAAKGLATADLAVAQSADETRAADELAAAARNAATTQARMRVADEGLVLLARAATRRNQLLAAQLRVQAAMAAAAGLPVETYAGADFKAAKAASAAGGWAKPDAEGPKP